MKDYLRVLPQDLPKSPDITPLLKKDLVKTGLTPQIADELLGFAGAEGKRIRKSQRQEKIDKIRLELHSLAKRGRYPKHLWTKLADYEKAQENDL